jgi:outer membrane protein OmpA-like peptidoglycan-associated protein
LVIPDVNKVEETSAKAILIAREMEALKKDAASKDDMAGLDAVLLKQRADLAALNNDLVSTGAVLARQHTDFAALKNDVAGAGTALAQQRTDLAALRNDYYSPERRLGLWISQNAVFFSDSTQFRDPDGVHRQLLELRNLLSPTALRLRLIGFTDSLGSAENNDQLGFNRAKAVADELIKLGIPANRLSPVGRAKEGLIVNGQGPASSNRRVEFSLVFPNEELK